MSQRSWTLAALVLAGTLSAQGVGSKLPKVELEDYSQTPARSFDDYSGRAVLIEFFAFW
jgi:hypothetical protein